MDSIDREVAKLERQDAEYRVRLSEEKKRTVLIEQPTFAWVFFATFKVWISLAILTAISWLLYLLIARPHGNG